MSFCPRNWLYLLIFLALSCSGASADAVAKSNRNTRETANKYASIVIDAETGAILSQSNPDKLLHPASLTKMMTLSLVFEALESGRLSPTQRIRISKRAAGQSPSKLGLKAGETIRVQDAVYAVVTKSANDISVALAEAVAGSESRFVGLMNARAKTIGMNRTQFRNASGLPDPRQISTPRDMAKLARYIIYSQPRYYPVFNKRSFTYNGHTYKNHNRLLDSYPGLDGMKTGYVNASGFNLVASAKRNGQRVIGVVFGGQSPQSRNLHMAALLDQGFSSARQIRLASASRPATPQPIRPVEITRSLSLTSAAYAAPEDRFAQITPEAGNTSPVLQNDLSGSGREIAALVAPLSPTHLPPPSARVETVRVASLSQASDADVTRQPVYIPRGDTWGNRPGREDGAVVQQTGWSVQVGAFQSRVATDQALYNAMGKLSPELGSKASALIVPLRTADAAWVFRARLTGFTRDEAVRACVELQDCLTISPQAN